MSAPADNSETKHDANNGRQRVIDKIAARFRKHGRERTAAPGANHAVSIKRLLLRGTGAIVLGTYVGIAGLAAASYLTEPLDNMAAQQSRGLTAGEAAMAQAIFGQDFDTQSVRLRMHDHVPSHIFNKVHDDGQHATIAYVNPTDTNNIHVIRPLYHTSDYSRANDMGMRGGVFMHELTHLWQNRTNTVAPSCKTYEYTLTPQSRFEDFCNEQQAEIIRDYTMRFIIPSHPQLELEGRFYAMFRAMDADYETQLNAADSTLARVVEAAFPHAASARLRIQTSFNNAAVCTDQRMRAAPAVAFQEHFNHCARIHVHTLNGETLTAQMSIPILQTPRMSDAPIAGTPHALAHPAPAPGPRR